MNFILRTQASSSCSSRLAEFSNFADFGHVADQFSIDIGTVEAKEKPLQKLDFPTAVVLIFRLALQQKSSFETIGRIGHRDGLVGRTGDLVYVLYRIDESTAGGGLLPRTGTDGSINPV